MEEKFIKDFLNIVGRYSPKYFINNSKELIIEPKNNIYFRLEDVNTELELKCKVLAWLSRPSFKGVSYYWQKRIRNIINDFLKTEFTINEMEKIYTNLGNDCDREKTVKFIESGYNLGVLSQSLN